VPAESLIIPRAAASVLKVALPTSMHTEGVWEVKVVGQRSSRTKQHLKKNQPGAFDSPIPHSSH